MGRSEFVRCEVNTSPVQPTVDSFLSFLYTRMRAVLIFCLVFAVAAVFASTVRPLIRYKKASCRCTVFLLTLCYPRKIITTTFVGTKIGCSWAGCSIVLREYFVWPLVCEYGSPSRTRQPLSWLVFYAPWCGYSKQLAPAWEDLANHLQKLDHPVRVAKIDASTKVYYSLE